MLVAAIAKRPRGAKPDLHQTEIAAIDGARIEIAFPPDDEPHQLRRQAVGLGMLDDQDLDRRAQAQVTQERAATNMAYGVPYLAGAYRAAHGDEARALVLYSRGYHDVH